MVVYFTASIVGKKEYLDNYLKIIDVVKKNNHKIISDHIIHVTPEEVDQASREERLAFSKKIEKWINICDFMVVEATFPSMSVGYEISLALNRGKPVLLLYNKGEPPALFAYHEDEKLIVEHYKNENLKNIIKDFLLYVEGVHGSRFTFYITSEIATHLSKKSKKNNIPKSVYLRQLIEKDMNSKK